MKLKYLLSLIAVGLNFEFSICQYKSYVPPIINQVAVPLYSQPQSIQQRQTEQMGTYIEESVRHPSGVSETVTKTISQPSIPQSSYSDYGRVLGAYGKRKRRNTAE